MKPLNGPIGIRPRALGRGRPLERGVTLLELTLTVLIFLLITGAIFGLVTQNQKIFVSQEQIAAAQQEARGALSAMSNYLLLAGCGVPAQLTVGTATNTSLNVAVVTATANSITFGGCFSDPPVRATLAATTTVAALGTGVTLQVDTAANFSVNDSIYLFSDYPWVYGTVSSINSAANPPTLTATFSDGNTPVPITFNPGSLIYRQEQITFAVNNSGVLQRTLTPGGTADLASNVTGLQFGYWNKTGAALTSFPLSEADRRAIQRVSIDLTLRSDRPDPQTNQFLSVRLSTAVQPRNLFTQ